MNTTIIAVVSVNSVRIKARDARRIADIKQIQNALELYNNEHGGMYPGAAADLKLGTDAAAKQISSVGIRDSGALAAGEMAYLNVVPHDPTVGKEYVYVKDNLVADPNRMTYTVTFTTEGKSSLGDTGNYKATPTGITQ